MSGGKKDFYSIADMSRDYAAWRKEEKPRRGTPAWSEELRLYHAEFTLAIAQQLAAISGHLAKIVGKAEDLNGSH